MSEEREDLTHLEEGVIENLTWVNRILASGAAFCGVIVLLKILGQKEISWQDISLSTKQAWLVISLLTLGHLYTANLMVSSTHALWKTGSSRAKVTFDKGRSTGGLFVRGMIPRVETIGERGIRKHIFRMDPKDPTAWLAYGSALLLLAAVIPFDPSQRYFFTLILGAAILAYINWITGATWIVAYSELAIPHDQSTYHLELSRRGRTWPRALYGRGSSSAPSIYPLHALRALTIALVEHRTQADSGRVNTGQQESNETPATGRTGKQATRELGEAERKKRLDEL